MRNDVKNFVITCKVCQQTKYLPQPPLGLLQPIASPTAVCKDIVMDFITYLDITDTQSVWDNGHIFRVSTF